jgi:hypothetical protein
MLGIPKNGKLGLAQKWNIVYVDDMPKEPKNGEMNPDFGLIVNKHFYLVSSFTSKRVLDLQFGTNRNLVIKTRLNKRSQKWYFDQNSLSIKNVYRYNWSIS